MDERGGTVSQNAVERTLGKLVTDDEFCARFFENPAAATWEAGLPLSALELEALSGLSRAAIGRVLRRPRVWADHIGHAFHAHEVGFQLWAQFLPQLNPIAAGLAGATGVGLPRYIVIASAAAMAWAGTWIAVGYLLADVLADAVAYRGVWIVVLIALAVVALGAIRYARRRRSRTELVKSAALVLVIAGASQAAGVR